LVLTHISRCDGLLLKSISSTERYNDVKSKSFCGGFNYVLYSFSRIV